MKTFKDNADRTWSISINVAAIKRVRGLLNGLDLLKLVDEGFAGLAALMGNPVDLVDVLFVLCKDEADKLGITDEDFGRAMFGDVLETASDAFLAEYTDFFPDPRKRQALKRVIEASRKVGDRLMTQVETRLDAIDPEAVAQRLIDSSGSSPESSGSTPARSRSESST